MTNAQTVGSGKQNGQTSDKKAVRLSVNLAADAASVLKRWAAQKDISITEAIRRAIAVWNFVESERAKGNRLAVIEHAGGQERVREIVLVD